ncbi:MAG: UDP-N-acetylglucosamine 2-epimerase (non-hydrolyzing) [Usitatibacter sp.]
MTSGARLPVSVRHGDTSSSRSRGNRLRSLAAGALRRHGDDAPKVILIVAGTRPECIKLAPVVQALENHPELSIVLVNSGQHLQAVHDSLAEFGLRADLELASLPKLPHLAASHQHLRVELRDAILRCQPDVVLVQGDTLTAYSGARAAHDTGHALAHVEAGLRTDTVLEPFPEEWFRRRIARYAQIHFAPSRSAVDNLIGEGIDDRTVHHVGNTGIDSLRKILEDPERTPAHGRRVGNTVLVTLHRRANYDGNAAIVCDALIDLAQARPELRVLFPVHPNPRISAMIRRRLGAHAAFDLVDPMAYRDFVDSAARAALIISDSGGIQEEAPHLGTPLLVPRCNTERPECLTTGFVRLVCVDRGAIVHAALDLLDAPRRPAVPLDVHAPFGAGNAAAMIVSVLETTLLERGHA